MEITVISGFDLTLEGDAFVTGAVSGQTDFRLAMPGVTAADTEGPDGWNRTSTLDCYRAHISGISRAGSLYSSYCKKGAAGDEVLQHPSVGTTNIDRVEPYRGQTLTKGAYVIAWAASNIRLEIHDDVSSNNSAYHSGGGQWEWLEVTRTVDSSAAQFFTYISADADSGDTFYATDPCLVFGSSIGAGNCVNQPGEILYVEDQFLLSSFNATAHSTQGATTQNLEVEAKLKVPKNISAIQFGLRAKDSGSAANPVVIQIGKSTTDEDPIYLDIGSQGLALTNDNIGRATPLWIGLDSNGDFETNLAASGSLTLDIWIAILGIQLR